MFSATRSKPTWLGVVPFISIALAIGAACSSGSTDNNGTAGSVNSSTGGRTATSSATGGAPGGTGTVASGGTSAVASGGKSCVAANPDIPADHEAEGYDTKPCSGCHGSAISGGFVFDPSGTVPVSQATVTITPASGAPRTAVTGTQGIFHFSGDIVAPFGACVSKCPDTVCAKATDHLNAGDCGTCHGVTEPKIHLP
jgi:hypothetical protein